MSRASVVFKSNATRVHCAICTRITPSRYWSGLRGQPVFYFSRNFWRGPNTSSLSASTTVNVVFVVLRRTKMIEWRWPHPRCIRAHAVIISYSTCPRALKRCISRDRENPTVSSSRPSRSVSFFVRSFVP